MSLRNFPIELTAAIRTGPAAVNAVAVIAGILLLLKIFWFDSLPEVFAGAEKLGHQFEELLNATLAAWTFFVISFQVPQTIERRRVGPAIARLGYDAAAAVYQIYIQLRPGEKVALNEIDERSVAERFRNVSPRAHSPLLDPSTLRPYTWLETLILGRDRFCQYIDSVWRYERFIDADLAELLDRIEFSGFSRVMNNMRNNAGVMGNPDLGVFSHGYFDCFEAARRLAAYCDRYVQLYKLNLATA